MKWKDVKKDLLKDPEIRYHYYQTVTYEADTTLTFTNYYGY